MESCSHDGCITVDPSSSLASRRLYFAHESGNLGGIAGDTSDLHEAPVEIRASDIMTDAGNQQGGESFLSIWFPSCVFLMS